MDFLASRNPDFCSHESFLLAATAPRRVRMGLFKGLSRNRFVSAQWSVTIEQQEDVCGKKVSDGVERIRWRG